MSERKYVKGDKLPVGTNWYVYTISDTLSNLMVIDRKYGSFIKVEWDERIVDGVKQKVQFWVRGYNDAPSVEEYENVHDWVVEYVEAMTAKPYALREHKALLFSRWLHERRRIENPDQIVTVDYEGPLDEDFEYNGVTYTHIRYHGQCKFEYAGDISELDDAVQGNYAMLFSNEFLNSEEATAVFFNESGDQLVADPEDEGEASEAIAEWARQSGRGTFIHTERIQTFDDEYYQDRAAERTEHE